MSKKLDLNTLLGEEKEITLGSKTYKIGDVPMSVVLHAENLGQSSSDVITLVMKILEANNEVLREDIEKMNIQQLKAIIEFTFADMKSETVKKKLEVSNEKLD